MLPLSSPRPEVNSNVTFMQGNHIWSILNISTVCCGVKENRFYRRGVEARGWGWDGDYHHASFRSGIARTDDLSERSRVKPKWSNRKRISGVRRTVGRSWRDCGVPSPAG